MNTIKYLAALFTAFAFTLPSLTNAQIGSLPEAAFGAHGLALGESALASPHDAVSNSWNPASITGLEKKTATVFFSKLPFSNDVIQTSYGMVIPTRKYGHFGVSFFHVGIGGIIRRDQIGEASGTISSKQDHLLFTYGRSFRNAFAVGVNVKFVKQSMAGFNSVLENPGMDFGMLYRFQSTHAFLRKLTVGIAIDNLAKPALKLSRQREALPRETRLLAEKELGLGEGKLTVLGNLAFPEPSFSRNRTRLHWGVEYAYKSVMALRLGANDLRFNAGVGLKFKGLIVDYSLSEWRASADITSLTSAIALTYQF